MSVTDPFTVVLNRLRALIEADAYLSTVIKTGNLITPTGTAQNPNKTNTQDADKPSIEIIPSTGNLKPHFSSTSVGLTERYTFVLVTGKLTVDSRLYPIKWALFQMLTTVTQEGLNIPFVTNADLEEDMIQGFDAALPENHNTAGWSLGLTLSVMMTFNKIGNVIQYP